MNYSSVAVVNHCDQKQLKEERFCLLAPEGEFIMLG